MKNILAAILLFSTLLGCATTYQFVEPQTSYELKNIEPGMAQVVFLRPSKGVMGAFQSVIFDITDGERKMLGVAPAKSKFAVDLEPGSYQFLSANGLPAHVMALNIEAEKRYYVVVRPIYGNGLQLRPVKRGIEGEFSFDNPEFKRWISATKVSVMASGADDWHTKFTDTIDKTQEKALKIWAEKDDSQRLLLTVMPSDAE